MTNLNDWLDDLRDYFADYSYISVEDFTEDELNAAFATGNFHNSINKLWEIYDNRYYDLQEPDGDWKPVYYEWGDNF